MIEKQKQIYVCLSDCGNVVKVGITYSINSRVSSLKTDEGASFSVLFCSEDVSEKWAKEVETKVTEKFKDYLIKGKEWYSIKPIEIIEFLIKDLKIQPYTIKEIKSEYPSWEDDNRTHKSYTEGQEIPLIKERRNKGLYSISYLNGSDIQYVGFCNYGDAKDFYTKNRYFVIMADNVVNLLYKIPKSTLLSFYISPKRNIYRIREQIKTMRDDLLKMTDI